jgi:hypothetical protein
VIAQVGDSFYQNCGIPKNDRELPSGETKRSIVANR